MKNYLNLFAAITMILLMFSCSKTEELVPNETDIIINQIEGEVKQTASKDLSAASPYQYPAYSYSINAGTWNTNETEVTLHSLSNDLQNIIWAVAHNNSMVAVGSGSSMNFDCEHGLDYQVFLTGTNSKTGVTETKEACIYSMLNATLTNGKGAIFTEALFYLCNLENSSASMGPIASYDGASFSDIGGITGVTAVVVPVVHFPE